MRRLIVCLAAVGVVTGLGAAPANAGEGNLKQFCKLTVALDTTDEPSEKQLNEYVDSAPPEIAEQVDQAVSTFEEQGEAAFEDEAFVALVTEVDQFAVDNCGFEQFEVGMQDYAFVDFPTEVEKGTVAFVVNNDGTELHEIHFVRLKGDATLDDILALPPDAEDSEFEELGTEVRGGAFAFPGASDIAFVTFKKPGTYVALCSIPVGTTPEAVEAEESGGEEHEEGSEEAPPHFTEGMAAEFEVVA
jgi:hypothetical protein